ncbi:MAG: phosphoribosylglycinamide formyltransferase [Bacteroidia bacterium]|nr:phosphoribosylglycinamide formyltransferase [Bacteroidia bacterium]
MQAGFKKKLVLFASGSGTNVEAIANYFQDHPDVSISAVLTNKRDAKVIDRCNRLNISVLYFNKWAFYRSDTVLEILRKLNPDLIVLAGFMWKVPKSIVQAFEGRILNIHPALLPKYGGKGMYGMHVHTAVKDSGDKQTGITIHYVNEAYDKGAIIRQAQVAVSPQDSAEDIAKKVHQLEYQHYPEVIRELLN